MDISYRCPRVELNDQIDGKRVIEIDPVGFLFRLAVSAGIDRCQSVDISAQALLVAGRDPGVVKAINFIRVIRLQISIKECLPGIVLDNLPVFFVCLIPGSPVFTAGDKQARANGRRQAGQDQETDNRYE